MSYKKIYICMLILGLLAMAALLWPKYQHWQYLLGQENELQQKVAAAKLATVLAKPEQSVPLVDTLQQILKLVTVAKLELNSFVKDADNNSNRLQLQGDFAALANFTMQLAMTYPIVISKLNLQKHLSTVELELDFSILREQMQQQTLSFKPIHTDLFCNLERNIDLTNIAVNELDVRGYIEQNGQHVSLVQVPGRKIILK